MTDRCPYPDCDGNLVDYTGPAVPRPSDQTLRQCESCSRFAAVRRGKAWPLADPTSPDTPAVKHTASP